MKTFENAFISRHSLKPGKGEKSAEGHFGISEQGVELARQRTGELAEIIDQSEPGSIIFIGGSSEEPRTKATADVYGEELQNMYETRKEEVIVIGRKDIDADVKENGKRIDKVLETINANKDKKIAISYPLFLKNLSMRGEGGLMVSDREASPFFSELIKNANYDNTEIVKQWIATEGQLENSQGADPSDWAKRYLEGIKRLNSFAKKVVPDRPVILGLVGHTPDIDLFLTYLKGGNIDQVGFEKFGSAIKETEIVRIDFKNKKFEYRQKEYLISDNVLN